MPEGKGSGKADDVFPRKVVHFKGTTEIKKAPTKVVILSTGQLDVALTLGIVPIGSTKGDGAATVPEYLKKAFPKQADKLGAIKDVGSRKSPSVEDIGNLSPDLILVNQAGKDDIDTLYKSLSEVAPTVVTQGKSEAWKQDFLLVADALGKPETAKKWMETYQVDAAKAGSAIDGNPTVSLLRKTSDKLRLFGAVSLAGSVLSDMGVARPSTQTFTDNGNKDISSETLAEAEAKWEDAWNLHRTRLQALPPPAGGGSRQADRLRAAQRFQQAQRRRLAPADQVGQVALRSALVLNGDEVRASGPSHVDGRDAGARQGLDRSA